MVVGAGGCSGGGYSNNDDKQRGGLRTGGAGHSHPACEEANMREQYLMDRIFALSKLGEPNKSERPSANR